MQLVYMIVGTLLGFIWLLNSIFGTEYQGMVEGLEGDEYPLKSLYSVGFVWNKISVFSLKGKIKEKLIMEARLLYEPKYAEYYATIKWVQMITFVHISLTIGFLLAGIANSGLMLVIGIAAAVLFGYYFINRMTDLLKNREEECRVELPEVISTLALLINAGMMLRDAWKLIAETKEGKMYELMKISCDDMENGMSEIDAIHKFGRYTHSAEVRKFTGALAQCIERGGSELNSFIDRQSEEMLVLKKQVMLQKGEAAATKLLLPTVMLFVGIIIAVICGALGSLI